MHAVMPRMLRKVTEPRKSVAHDYAIDVEKRVQEVLHAHELDKKKRRSGTARGAGTLATLNETAR